MLKIEMKESEKGAGTEKNAGNAHSMSCQTGT